MKSTIHCFKSIALTLLAGVALLPQVVSAGNITPVDCTGNPTDRALLQSAVDDAGSGDVLMLVGTCQLDGTQVFISKSNLTITGAGSAGNWSTVVQGIASGGGSPVGDSGPPTFANFNRGFHIGDSSGNTRVANVQIENIKFSTLHRGVIVSPQIGGNTALCSGTTIGTGAASSIVVENNWFDNDDRAAQIFGTATNITFQNNRVTNGTFGNIDFFTNGQIIGCVGGAGFLSPLGIPQHSAIVGNSISAVQEFAPILVSTSDTITVANNSLSTSAAPDLMILLEVDSNSHVSNNQINAGGVALGIFASDDGNAVPGFPPNSSHVEINNNSISNSVAGVTVDSETTGYSIINNVFSNSSIADIVLCGTVEPAAVCDGSSTPSFNNKVVTTNFSNTVINDGTNNKLLGTQKLLNNPQVPPGVKAKLSGRAVGRP